MRIIVLLLFFEKCFPSNDTEVWVMNKSLYGCCHKKHVSQGLILFIVIKKHISQGLTLFMTSREKSSICIKNMFLYDYDASIILPIIINNNVIESTLLQSFYYF